MNRTTCRAVGIVAGIVLGIYAAGALEPVLPFVGVSLAGTSNDDHAGDDTDRPTDGDHDELANLAEPLLPQPEHVTWYRPVLWGAIWLFAGALVIGGVSLKLRGPEPPEPADSHDEHHDKGGGEHH